MLTLRSIILRSDGKQISCRLHRIVRTLRFIEEILRWVALNLVYFAPRIQFCRWYLPQCEEDNQFSRIILFSDKASLTRQGLFNHLNMSEEMKFPTLRSSDPYKLNFPLMCDLALSMIIRLGPIFLQITSMDFYINFLWKKYFQSR